MYKRNVQISGNSLHQDSWRQKPAIIEMSISKNVHMNAAHTLNRTC